MKTMLSNCTKRLGASWIHLILFVISIIAVICSAQTTILSPSCVPDPSDPRKNILEITGNSYSSTSFSITSTVDNCHLYIHDLLVTSIKITSTIINNSNITIRNVSSSNKSVATFIWFANAVEFFSFINISNVRHSSLSIDTSKTADKISIVKFDSVVTGKSVVTSWIDFSGFEMNDVFCDGSAGGSNVCSIAMIHFTGSVTEVGTLSTRNFVMKNISTNSSYATTSTLSAVSSAGDLSLVDKISFVNFEVRDAHSSNKIGGCELLLLKLISTSAAISSLSSDFIVRDFVVNNFTCNAERGTSTLKVLSATPGNYKTMQISNISAASWNSSSRSRASIIQLCYFASTVSAPVDIFSVSSSSPKLLVDGIWLLNSSCIGGFAQMACVYISGTVEDYNTVAFTNLSVISSNSTATAGDSALYIVYIVGSLKAPVASRSSKFSSFLTVDSIHLQGITSTGSVLSDVAIVHVSWALTNFNSIQLTNTTGRSVSVASSSSSSSLFVFEFGSSITAPADTSSPASTLPQLIVERIQLHDASVTGTASSKLYLWFVAGAVDNFTKIQFETITASSLNATATSASDVAMLHFASSATAREAISSSSYATLLLINDVRLENTSSTLTFGISKLVVVYFVRVLKGFNSIEISNLSAMKLNSISETRESSIFFVRFDSAIAAPVLVSSSSPPSSLKIFNLLLQNFSSSAVLFSQIFLVSIGGDINNFDTIQISTLNALYLNSTSYSNNGQLHTLMIEKSIIARNADSPTSILFSNILLDNLYSNGYLDAQLYLFYGGGDVINYQSITISNVTIRALTAISPTAASSLYLWVFVADVTARSSSLTSSSFIVDNIKIENISSTAKSSTDVYCFWAYSPVKNYADMRFTNIRASAVTSRASAGSATFYLLNFGSVTAPISSSNAASLLFSNIQLHNCACIAESYSDFLFLSVPDALSIYSSIQFTNFTAVSVTSTATSSYSKLYFLVLHSLVAASSTSSSSLLRVDNIWIENVVLSTSSMVQIWLVCFLGIITNFNALRLSNITVISAIATSMSDQSSVYLIRFDSSVTAPASKFPSVRIDNIWMQNCSVTASLDSELWFVAFIGSLIDYREVELANFTALTLNANSSFGGSSVYLAFFFSSISSAALSPSSMSISNLRLQNATSIGNGRSQVFTFHVGGAVNNVNQIAIRNVSSSNVFASSTILSIATYYAISFGGLSNCSSLLVEAVQMWNISSIATGSSSSSTSSTVALLYFDSVGTYKNISQISVQHCTVRQVSVFSHGQSAVRLVETDIPAESIVVNNNSLLLHASTGALFSASQTISAALVGLSFVSSGGFETMRVTNNVLNILDQTWKEICAPANCSMVRINKVQRGSNNNNNNINPSTISLTGNELVNQNISSFISFAKYAADSASDVLNFVLEDNTAHFVAGPSSTSSLLGFDESPTPSSSFPALVHVEVKCNEWPRTVDRGQQQLLSNAFSRLPLRDFIDWTCRSHSVSKNASRSVSAAASSSFSPSVVPSTSLSLSIFQSKTKSSDISSSMSISASASPDRSTSASNGTTKSATPFKNPSPFILKISEPVNSALLVSDGTQAAAMVSVAVFSSIAGAPALGFTIGRQQAMMDFAQKSLRGDCRGLLPSTTVKNFEDEVSNPLGLGDSPTQLSIGGTEKLMSYYVGAVVGNCVLIVCLVAANQGIGMGALKFLRSRIRWIRKFVKKNAAASMLAEQCGAFNKKEPLKKIMRRVFAKSYVSLTLFFCLSFLLTPTLSSALIVLVAAKNDPELEGQQVSGYLKLVSLVCAIVFSIVAIYFVTWSVKLRRKRKEKFRSLRDLGLESHRTERTIASWLFKARGEWRYPPASNISVSTIFSAAESNSNAKNDKKLKKSKDGKKPETNYNDFLIAEPAFESYRTSVWFSIVEIATAIALALPPFVAQFASSAKSSCLLEGIVLLIILLLYTTLLIWKNPFKLRILRIANPILSLQQLVIVVISLIFVAKRNGDDSNATAETPAWFWRILMVPLGFQSLISVLMMGAAVFPILMFLKKLRGRAQRRRGIQINNRDDVVPSHQSAGKTATAINHQKLEETKRKRTKQNGNAHNTPRITGNDADEIAMEVQI